METHTIARETSLYIAGGDGRRHYGADQEWFSHFWRRKAGCGPTTAAQQMAYLSRSRPGLAPLCPLERLEQGPFSSYMDEVWAFVTPGMRGLDSIDKYADGVSRFARARGLELRPVTLVVPAGTPRPSLDQCLSFLRAGLEDDCPVAFLNLDNGGVRNLDSWHWVLLTGVRAEAGGLFATAADGGRRVEIDLGLWHQRTRAYGGFVRLEAA